MGFGDSLKSGFNNAVKKTGDAVDNAGINSKISGKKNEIDKLEEEIGTTVFTLFEAGGEFNDDIKSRCEKIKALNAEIVELEAQKK